MPYVSKWSHELKAAAMSAVFDRDMSAARAHALAVRGELQPLQVGAERPPAAPDLPLGTVRDWARHERSRRRQLEISAAAPEVVLGGTVARLAAVLERELRRAEVNSAKGKLKPETLQQLAKAGESIARLSHVVKPSRSNDAGDASKGSSSPAPAAAAANSSGFLDALAAEDT